jgi:hypothetical protein
VIKRIIVAVLLTVFVLGFAIASPRQQVAAVVGDNTLTSAGAGVFPAGASFNGVQLAGGTFAMGVQTYLGGSTTGDIEVQLNGSSPIGLSQWITVTGWVTNATIDNGTWTMNGTCTLDMGDGTPPVGNVPLIANATATGVTLTVGGTVLPTLPKSDGWIATD